MKRTIQLVMFLFLFSFVWDTYAQIETNIQALQDLSVKFNSEFEKNRAEVIEYARTHNVLVRFETEDAVFEMQYIDEFGKPQYYKTENKNAAASVSTNKVHTGGGSGLDLDGSGMTIHEWDGGGVLTTHQEFGSRVTQGDVPSSTNYHSTHVAGTMIAYGVNPAAKGMAPMANLMAFDWNNDNAEMASEAASGALISNHSYGSIVGWYYNGTNWYWYGTPSVSQTEDYFFGFYDAEAQAWDEIANNAPYYLICKSAGNDRGQNYSGQHYVWGGTSWVLSTTVRDADGGTTGYDCIGSQATAKNILTIGAINDIPNSYEQPSDVVMSSFSAWGPADDGRIKPDLVANGVGLYSTYDGSNTDYNSISGTSMASPNAAGSLLLLQEHYEDLNGIGVFMKASTLKALAIHTADEAGPSPGPDYMNGWGLLNIDRAAKKISEDQVNDVISEHTLNNGGTYSTNITATSGYPIKVTVVWTDPKGMPTTPQLNPSVPMLVNDLDLRITQGASIFYPWKLNRSIPADAATRSGENNVDNVEVVFIENPTPGETYTITVDHDGTLSVPQVFSMIINGYPLAPTANFFADKKNCQVNETVTLTDVSTEHPTSWLWGISPATFNFVNSTTSNSQNPQVQFTAPGFYEISLSVQNAAGNNTKVKTDYIFATNAPIGYCEAYSTNPYGTINQVQFGTINNYSGYTNVGSTDPNDKYYDDFTSLITEIFLNETISLTVSSNYTDSGLDLGVWIDWNRDGDFDDTGENVVCEEDGGGVGTFNITAPGSASLGHTHMRLRTKYYNTGCGSPCGSTANGEVEDYTINVLGIPNTWEGTTSTDWATASNWNPAYVPTTSFNVTIPTLPTGPNFPVIAQGTDAFCNDLTIQSGANLNVYGSLTVDGTLTNNSGTSGLIVKSDATGTGSLIANTNTVNVSVERYFDGGKWHLFGAPVDNQTANAVYFNHSPDVWLKSYVESTDTWSPTITDINTPMPLGRGFAIWIQTENNATASFENQLNSSDFLVNGLSFTDATHGYNLVANPFTAAIDWDQGNWARTNLDGSVWVYDPVSGSYKDRNSVGIGSLTSGIIPSSQAFFVRTISSGGSISIPANARVHSNQSFYKNGNNTDEENQQFTLAAIEVSKGEKTDETWFIFNDACTESYDNGWDVFKFFGDIDAPQLYAVEADNLLSVDALPAINGDIFVSLNFSAGASGNHLLKLKTFENFVATELWLEDIKEETLQELTSNPEYNFYAATYNAPERFLLHFIPQVTGIIQNTASNYSVYSWKNSVYIKNPELAPNTTVEIVDIYGRIIYQGKLQPVSLNKIELNLSNSYLVVRLTNNGNTSVQKVFIR